MHIHEQNFYNRSEHWLEGVSNLCNTCNLFNVTENNISDVLHGQLVAILIKWWNYKEGLMLWTYQTQLPVFYMQHYSSAWIVIDREQ